MDKCTEVGAGEKFRTAGALSTEVESSKPCFLLLF